MSFLAVAKIDYRARLQRSELLVQRYPSAREVLTFYGHVARFQSELYAQLPKLLGTQSTTPQSIRSELDVSMLLEVFARFLSLVESQGPHALSMLASDARTRGETAWIGSLTQFWQDGLLESPASYPVNEFLPRAFLQPCAELRASRFLHSVLPTTVCRCPWCNSLPLLGVLRPEGDGGKRFLLCSFCSREWEFHRILCAHCGEEQEQKLPVYVSEQFSHIRIECCETCKHFLRSIDLTKDGNAVPIVDDLATIPLTLWAVANGYARIQGNLLGT